MIIEIPDGNSIIRNKCGSCRDCPLFVQDGMVFNCIINKAKDIKAYCWKKNDEDEWQSAEIPDLIKAYEKRPKGEWKITDAYPHKVYCSRCFKTYAQKEWRVWEDKTLPRNFCPNCGTDMRKGSAE